MDYVVVRPKFAHCEACERNKEPILRVLLEVFDGLQRVFEIGSGTGQHALHFTKALPNLWWEPTEIEEAFPALLRRVTWEGPENLMTPVVLDASRDDWPDWQFEGLFTANTLHIMSWPTVQSLFRGLNRALRMPGIVVIYGPFRYGGRHTSRSNADFDRMLRRRDPASGVRDFEAVDALARDQGYELLADFPMPANNRTLVWRMGRWRA